MVFRSPVTKLSTLLAAAFVVAGCNVTGESETNAAAGGVTSCVATSAPADNVTSPSVYKGQATWRYELVGVPKYHTVPDGQFNVTLNVINVPVDTAAAKVTSRREFSQTVPVMRVQAGAQIVHLNNDIRTVEQKRLGKPSRFKLKLFSEKSRTEPQSGKHFVTKFEVVDTITQQTVQGGCQSPELSQGQELVRQIRDADALGQPVSVGTTCGLPAGFQGRGLLSVVVNKPNYSTSVRVRLSEVNAAGQGAVLVIHPTVVKAAQQTLEFRITRANPEGLRYRAELLSGITNNLISGPDSVREFRLAEGVGQPSCVNLTLGKN